MYGKEKPVKSWGCCFRLFPLLLCQQSGRKQHCRIYIRPFFCRNYPAFQLQDQSNVDIQALCDCTVYVINHSQLADFYDINNDHQKLGRRIAETLLWEIYDRMISMYSLTPEERYLDIINRCPDLLKLITLKELASYLLIRPETLSRIRRKVVQK